MSEVISLHGGFTGERIPEEHAIAVLEDYLERARSGEVIAVLVAALSNDKTASYQLGGLVGGYPLIGAASMALDDLQAFVREHR